MIGAFHETLAYMQDARGHPALAVGGVRKGGEGGVQFHLRGAA
jgi:hypothetical protein